MDFIIITDEIQGELEVTLLYTNLNLSSIACTDELILVPVMKVCALFTSTGKTLKRVFTEYSYQS